ncbi:5'-methylthioadenosine/S-adenosylhomocysteine nucleosidase [Novosphingobium sp. 11B]
MQEQVVKPTSIAGMQVLFVMAIDHEYGPHLRARMTPLMTGVGPVEAAIAATACLQRLEASGQLPDLVVTLGSAGSRRCRMGEVYQIESVSWRDMDASRLGFARGVTPFADHPAVLQLPVLFPDLPRASLSTGGDVIGGEDYARIDADLVDMETYAVLRACQRFGVPMIGLRGVSDGADELEGMSGWTELLALLDERLAIALDKLAEVLERGLADSLTPTP